MRNSGGSVLASFRRTSYVRVAPRASMVRVVGSMAVVVMGASRLSVRATDG
jgi:hypothetical protein